MLLIGRRKGLDKSRKQVRLDLDVNPVRGRGVSERASGRAAGGMERLRQDRNGAGSGPCFFCSLALLTCAPLSLSFPFAFVSFLVSDLLLISSVYISLPHTRHTIALL